VAGEGKQLNEEEGGIGGGKFERMTKHARGMAYDSSEARENKTFVQHKTKYPHHNQDNESLYIYINIYTYIYMYK